jgi:hypothetical protein
MPETDQEQTSKNYAGNTGRAASFVAFAAGTLTVTLGIAMFLQVLAERSLESLARLGAGESDFERKN